MNNKFENIKEGEYLSFTQYLKVNSKTKDSIIVTNQFDQQLEITGIDLIESLNSAGQHNQVKIAGKNEIIDILHSAKDKVFTVNFIKADNSERTLIGRLYNIESQMGRTNVVDLEVTKVDKTFGIRQIDNRQINWIVLNSTKYVTK
jgi:hypothetical protein